MSQQIDELAKLLRVPSFLLEDLEKSMKAAGFPSALGETAEEVEERRGLALAGKDLQTAGEVRGVLAERIREHEAELYELVGVSRDNLDFGKVAEAARSMASVREGFFLKKELAEQILRKRPPERMLEYFGYEGTEELLARQDVGEVVSALRFTETDEWMHETFDVAYREFTAEDFEKRPIEVRVLGPQWKEIAEKYVAKKHHNVSHLKEFGVIFLNPIAQSGEGKFLRDFALLLHYFHEVVFYGKLFERAARYPDFPERFTSLLRGDVPEKTEPEKGEWLIVQRYLWKENPEDDRLFLPRVNPEALHWMKAQQDMAEFGFQRENSGLEFWNELWYTAGMFPGKGGEEELVSFHFEDNAMAVAAASDGSPQTFFYHQREALWNKLAANYLGGYEDLQAQVAEHMDEGTMQLGKLQSA